MRQVWVMGLVLVLACNRADRATGGIADPATLLRGVPADATAVIIGQSPVPLTQGGFFLDDAAARAMAAELAETLKARTGLDPSEVRSATAFLRGQGGALIVFGVRGELKPDAPLGAKALKRDDLLIVGSDDAVDAVVAVLDGKAPAMKAGASPLADLLVLEGKGAYVVVGLSATATDLPGVEQLTGLGIREVSLAIKRTGLRAVATAEEAKVAGVAKIVTGGLEFLVQTVDGLKRQAQKSGALAEELQMIAAAHHVAYLRRIAQPREEKGRVVVDMPFESSAAALMIPAVGILSAVAIPAFMKNARKAKTAEAVVLSKRLYDGARTAAEEASPPAILVGKVGPTPPLGACCKQDGSKCAPNPAAWTDPMWQKLQFSVDDPHYFSYTYEADATSFTVRASGDLDCDGVYSTFEMVGTMTDDGMVSGGGGMYRDHELE